MRKKIGNRDGEVNMKWREGGEERRVDRERDNRKSTNKRKG